MNERVVSTAPKFANIHTKTITTRSQSKRTAGISQRPFLCPALHDEKLLNNFGVLGIPGAHPAA